MKVEDLARWNNSRVRGFLSALNEQLMPDHQITLNNRLALEALAGLYIDVANDNDAVNEVVRFFAGRGSMKASEYKAGVDLGNKLLEGVLGAYAVAAEFELEDGKSSPKQSKASTNGAVSPGRTRSADLPNKARSNPGPASGVTESSKVDGSSQQGGASCADRRLVPDPDIFFSGTPDEARKAKSICRSCPISVRCLRQALGAEVGGGDGRYGILGGLSPRERTALARRVGRRLAPLSSGEYSRIIELKTRPYRGCR